MGIEDAIRVAILDKAMEICKIPVQDTSQLPQLDDIEEVYKKLWNLIKWEGTKA